MPTERPEINDLENDILPETIRASRRRAKVMAGTLVALLILATLFPPSYRNLAPLLFIAPLIFTIAERIRKARARSTEAQGERSRTQFPGRDGFPSDPYSHSPRDPKDPRRYKPIG